MIVRHDYLYFFPFLLFIFQLDQLIGRPYKRGVLRGRRKGDEHLRLCPPYFLPFLDGPRSTRRKRERGGGGSKKGEKSPAAGKWSMFPSLLVAALAYSRGRKENGKKGGNHPLALASFSSFLSIKSCWQRMNGGGGRDFGGGTDSLSFPVPKY